ncbi:MAG: radical SAM protein [Candidatus Gastranaerophilales bacterium]|nr:radical SAM protein [Candidatus Gastranaerophilales bacterium]
MQETFLYDRNNDKNSSLKVWLAFPGIYAFGMSSIGYLSVFRALDELDDVFAERIFTDTKNTQIKPENVDVFGFSTSFELDFLSIFKLLEKYNIPLFSKDRDEFSPIIYGGGPVLSSNPEPFAEVFDFIMIGDAEDTKNILFETIRVNKGRKKSEILELISKIEGVYVPSLTQFSVEKNQVLTLSGDPYSVKKCTTQLDECIYTPILSEESYFSNTFIVEIARGCSNCCGFCQAAYLNLPVRFVDYEKIIEAIELGLKHTNKIALLGALICAHPRFDDICDYIINKVDNGENIEVSVSSLRADYVSEKTIEMLVKCGQRNATIAIEAGSERLRKVINKHLSEEQIFNMVKMAKEGGLHGLKIYAMIGLPTETQDDLIEMIDLIKRIKEMHKGFDLTVSFGTFVPKSHTPFQYCEREATKSLEKKYEFLKKEFHKMGVKIRCSSVKWDYIQAIMSRGDRRLSEYLVEVYRCGSNIGCFKNTYKEFIKKNKLPKSEKFALAPRSLSEANPWDFICLRPGIEALKKEYDRLLR